LDTERKKELMVKTRTVAYRRAREGFLEVLQKGEVISNPSEDTVRVRTNPTATKRTVERRGCCYQNIVRVDFFDASKYARDILVVFSAAE
jgi:Protein of unknown function (DUF3253)